MFFGFWGIRGGKGYASFSLFFSCHLKNQYRASTPCKNQWGHLPGFSGQMPPLLKSLQGGVVLLKEKHPETTAICKILCVVSSTFVQCWANVEAVSPTLKQRWPSDLIYGSSLVTVFRISHLESDNTIFSKVTIIVYFCYDRSIAQYM